MVRPNYEGSTRFQLGFPEFQIANNYEHFFIVDIVVNLYLIQLLGEKTDRFSNTVLLLD